MKQILIIDDDTYINDMLSELLAGESYSVLVLLPLLPHLRYTSLPKFKVY